MRNKLDTLKLELALDDERKEVRRLRGVLAMNLKLIRGLRKDLEQAKKAWVLPPKIAAILEKQHKFIGEISLFLQGSRKKQGKETL